MDEQRLFDPGPKRDPHPGDLTPDQWGERSDVATHVSIEPKFDNTRLATHLGTERAGVEANVGSFYPPKVGLYRHPRRMTDLAPESDDASVNVAHYEWSNSRGIPVGSGVEETAHIAMENMDYSGTDVHGYEEVDRVISDLESGSSVPYENTAEDVGSISFVTPAGGTRSYIDDVAASPNRNLNQKQWAMSLAGKGGASAITVNERHEFTERSEANQPNFRDHLLNEWKSSEKADPSLKAAATQFGYARGDLRQPF